MTGNSKVACNCSNLANLSYRPAIDENVLHSETLGVSQNPILGSCHGMLANEQNAIIEFVGKIVRRRRRPALKEFCFWMNVVYGKCPTAVVSIPNHHLTCPRPEYSLNRSVQFTNQQPMRFLKAPLSRQQLLVCVVDSTNTFHIGHDQNACSVRSVQRVRD
jgi:hypothetical protein